MNTITNQLKDQYAGMLNQDRAKYLKKLKDSLGDSFVNLEAEDNLKKSTRYSDIADGVANPKDMNPLQKGIMELFVISKGEIDRIANWNDVSNVEFEEVMKSHAMALNIILSQYPNKLSQNAA